MKATKINLTVQIEVLSIDSIPGLLSELILEIGSEKIHGKLVADDGDSIIWNTNKHQVNF